MQTVISTVAFRGIDTIPVKIQVHITKGLSAMAIVDLADKAVAESRERVRAAFGSIGLARPPGADKSMLAACLPGLLPPLSPREALDVTMLHSISGQLPAGGLIKTRPFWHPHHSASMTTFLGGGTWAKSGEISLPHREVLFLDELAKCAKLVLNALQQPLDIGCTVVARANHHVTYSA